MWARQPKDSAGFLCGAPRVWRRRNNFRGIKWTCAARNWFYKWLDAIGGLEEAKVKPVNADQMEIARLRAELAKTRMERGILKKVAAYFARESR
ncbi:MAG: hypothetical protein FJX32_14425 [Alphaproteobacteria bacterium]|nr:hypothetical protein [Alphaproteobacteria bacterium]